jgi:hypothetical protein
VDVNFYATRAHALVLKQREDMEAAYDRHSEMNAFWAFVDLKNSANYRIARGPKKGYVRGETFFAIVRTVIGPAEDVRLLKEMGDAVMLSCRDFTPLLESVLLIDHVARQIAGDAEDAEYPFGVRAGLSSGPAKRLIRDNEDFLGRPLDELARIMTVRSANTNLLIHDHVFTAARDFLAEYAEVVTVGDAVMIPAAMTKGAVEPIYYRELIVNQSSLGKFRRGFSSWRKPAQEAGA